MKRLRQEKENKLSRQQKIVKAILLLTIVVLVISQIGISNSLSTSGETVLNLERQAKILKKENESLQAHISQKNSLRHIEERAKALGFVKMNNILSISTAIPIALKP